GGQLRGVAYTATRAALVWPISHLARPNRCCTPYGVVSPLTSAGCQPFLRSTGLSKTHRYAPARRRASQHGNRAPIRRSTSVSSSSQAHTVRRHYVCQLHLLTFKGGMTFMRYFPACLGSRTRPGQCREHHRPGDDGVARHRYAARWCCLSSTAPA